MKTITRLFLVGLIALGMTTCSNENEIDLQGQPESRVSVKVMAASNGPVVRATGDLSGATPNAVLTAESEIKTLEVYLFTSTGVLDGYKKAEPAEGQTTVTQVSGIATHSGAKTMVVVANGDIGAVTSETALLEKTKNLPVEIANGLVMTAEPVKVTLKEGENQYGYADQGVTTTKYISAGTPLALHRVNARVTIIGATLGTLPAGQAAFFDELTEVQVAMFNVPKTTELFGKPLETSGDYLFGDKWPGTSYTVGSILNKSEPAFLESTVDFPIIKTVAPYFYVNENTSDVAKEQMMIVVRAKPTLDGNPVTAEGLYTDVDGYTYYPIWVNGIKDGYTYNTSHTADSKVMRNTQYNISLTIKGLGSPTIDPPVMSTLDVAVSVEAWRVVEQGVVWN